MASTERSLGWATSGTGDGPAGGYDSARWKDNARKTDGAGVTLFGSELAATGVSTSTLTIGDGAALIGGYTYESNGTVTISTSGLSGSYYLILVANNTASAVTVTANGAGTTTILASTVRAAIATAAQISTITAAVGTANIITLAGVGVLGGTISTISNYYPIGTSMQLPQQVYGILDALNTNLSVANATYVDISSFALSAVDGSNLISASIVTGVFNVVLSGLYQVTATVSWDSNTTGNRTLLFSMSSSPYTLDSSWQTASAALVGNGTQQATGIVYLIGPATIKAQVYQTSGATRQITNANIKIVRL